MRRLVAALAIVAASLTATRADALPLPSCRVLFHDVNHQNAGEIVYLAAVGVYYPNTLRWMNWVNGSTIGYSLYEDSRIYATYGAALLCAPYGR